MFLKCETTRIRRNSYKFLKILNGVNVMFYVLILFIPLMLVRVSAITVYPNFTSTTNKTFNQSLNNQIATIEKINHKQNNNNFNNNSNQLNHSIATNFVAPSVEAKNKMLTNMYELQEQQQQQQQQQHQQQLLHEQHPPPTTTNATVQSSSSHVNSVSENAYLLERNNSSLREPSIYDGTWRTKAKRLEPSSTSSLLSSIPHEQQQQQQHQQQQAIDSAILDAMKDVDNDYARVEPHRHNNNFNYYERLGRRLSITKPDSREFDNQIPRPPRLHAAPETLTATLRRQYDDGQPKPFHFPYEGPQPEEFQNTEAKANNIQELLHNLHLNELYSTRLPPFSPPMIIPTGLHISGSFKNLKSSGLLNFLRNKRHKAGMPMWQQHVPNAVSLPLHMLNVYPTPINFGLTPQQQSYQQRLAMDQFYPFKPKSPNDINLLQQQQQYQSQNNKPKKHKKKHKSKNHNLMWPSAAYGSFGPGINDIFPAASMYPPLVALNISQPPALTKRLPFKVNLDIFPMLPPAKTFRMPRPATDMNKLKSALHPTVGKNPFSEYFTTAPATGTTAGYNFYNNQKHKPASLYNPMRFPGHVQPMPQSSNNAMYYMRHPAQFHKQQYYPQPHHMPLTFPTNECDQQQQQQQAGSTNIESVNSRGSPILLHLNVFPKEKLSKSSEETNPFYANLEQLQRKVNEVDESTPTVKDANNLETKRNVDSSNQASNLVRNDSMISQLGMPSQPLQLVQNPSYGRSLHQNHGNMKFMPNMKMGQVFDDHMSEESHFRLPIEDLITFQVQDAL